jgi:hypothetical protein
MISDEQRTTRPIERSRRWTFVLLALGLIASPRAQDSPLTGSWVLNDALSDDIASVMQEASSADRKKLDGGLKRFARSVVVFGIPVGELPLPSNASKSSDEEQQWGDSGYVFDEVTEIRILQQDDATQLEYGNERLLIYRHGVAMELDHETVEANWHRNELVIEHALDDDGTIVETFRIDPASHRLAWTVELERKKAKAIEIVRVYERKTATGLDFVSYLSTR